MWQVSLLVTDVSTTWQLQTSQGKQNRIELSDETMGMPKVSAASQESKV